MGKFPILFVGSVFFFFYTFGMHIFFLMHPPTIQHTHRIPPDAATGVEQVMWMIEGKVGHKNIYIFSL